MVEFACIWEGWTIANYTRLNWISLSYFSRNWVIVECNWVGLRQHILLRVASTPSDESTEGKGLCRTPASFSVEEYHGLSSGPLTSLDLIVDAPLGVAGAEPCRPNRSLNQQKKSQRGGRRKLVGGVLRSVQDAVIWGRHPPNFKQPSSHTRGWSGLSSRWYTGLRLLWLKSYVTTPPTNTVVHFPTSWKIFYKILSNFFRNIVFI